MKVVPICLNCKWCQPFELNRELSKCAHPTGTSVVTGAAGKHRFEYCNVQRNDGWFWCRFLKTCGKEGRFFEVKS